MTPETKNCAYCLRPHERRGRCCSPEHGRKVSSRLASERAARTRNLARILERAQARFVHERLWRDVAMGREPEAALERLFGHRLDGCS